jgi:GxxExxY protein
LKEAGMNVQKQMALPVIYRDVKLDAGYRVDLLVESKVVVEIKAVEALNELHFAQLLTYLKWSKCKLGLLLNFNVSSMKQGIRRVANGMKD